MSFECEGVGKVFPTRKGSVTALEGVTFKLAPRQFVCLVGPSGCGKTTLLRIFAGLLKPSSGRMRYGELADGVVPHNALVFQEHGLFPWMTVLENVAFPLEVRGIRRRERSGRAREFLDRVGLGAFADNHPHELSVGMRQRVNIARALIANPDVLLMDEPFAALDAQTKVVLQEELLRIWERDPKLIVYVTHDIREAVLMADRILVMSGRPGRIRDDIPVSREGPRDLTGLEQPEAARNAQRIWKILEEEVRSSLRVGS